MAINALVSEHRLSAVLAYIALYVVTVALSVPGAVFLTPTGRTDCHMVFAARTCSPRN